MPYGDSRTKNSAFDATTSEWWRAGELGKHPHELLDTLVEQLEDDQSPRYMAYREYARLFGADPDMFGYESSILDEELIQNELANTLETLHAQVFKNTVVPGVTTSEADWEEWNRGKAYSRWIDGVLATGEAHYDAVPRAGMDAMVYGTGFIKIGHCTDKDDYTKLEYHRTDTRMMTVDRLEARHGKPRSLFQKDFYDRFLLADIYGKQEKGMYDSASYRLEHILSTKANDDDDMALGSRTKCEMVRVREAWHLPNPSGKYGRHVIWIKGCTLVDEPWTWDRFPFTVIRFGNRLGGFYGESAVKRLAPTQKQFNKLNRKIDEAQDIMGVPRIILGNGANLEMAHIDDVPGSILRVDGSVDAAIKEWNAMAVSPELYQEREAAPRKMRSLLGVSDFEVQNQLPQSMREISGPAMERWVDSGTARHAMFHKELERAMIDLAYMSMDYAAELQKDGIDLCVCSPGDNKSSIELLKFSEVKVDKKRMKLRVQPMNQMPQTIAGKIDAFDKMRERGDLSKAQYLRMLEVPDMEGASDILKSDEEIILKNLHFMCKKKSYIPPLQYDNLDLIVPITTAFINHYRIRDDADMEVVGMLAQYIEDAILLKKGLGGGDPNAPPPDMGVGMPVPGMDPSMANEAGQMGPPMGDPMAGQAPMGTGMPPGMGGVPPGPLGPPMMGPPGPMGPPMM